MKDFPNEGYLGELREQRKAWLRKPVLRSLYAHWYAECASCFAPLTPVVEIGSGCGNFKEFYGDVVCTDLVRGGEWIDLVMDAQELPLAAGRVGNLFVIDVLHHLRRPLDFLLQAVAALKPGGRLILCEPALSTWSKFVYGRFHHEPMDISWDPFAPEETSARADTVMEFANEAIPEILAEERTNNENACGFDTGASTQVRLTAVPVNRGLQLSIAGAAVRFPVSAEDRRRRFASVRRPLYRNADAGGTRESAQ